MGGEKDQVLRIIEKASQRGRRVWALGKEGKVKADHALHLEMLWARQSWADSLVHHGFVRVWVTQFGSMWTFTFCHMV